MIEAATEARSQMLTRRRVVDHGRRTSCACRLRTDRA